MNEAAIRKKLAELCETVATIPSAGVGAQPIDGIYCSETSQNAHPMEDSLDYLRLQIKYLMFDLEATRRENRYLRQMLNSRRPGSDDFRDDTSDP